MPTMTLTVDGQPGVSGSGWVANTGTKADAVASENGDTAYIEAGADTELTHFTFTNPSVASGDTSLGAGPVPPVVTITEHF